MPCNRLQPQLAAMHGPGWSLSTRTRGIFRWRCSAGSTGPRTITTSRWSTRTAPCWPNAGSATTRPGSPRCCSCWPRPATTRTSRSRWRSRPATACWWPGLRATGRPVFPINPMSVSRYRDRHSVARRKSDAGDAFVLANILRTDLAAHRPLPADSELAQAIAVLARAQQDAVWARTDAHNKLRSLLREFYPAILPGVRQQARRAAATRSPRPARRRPHPARRGPADPVPTARAAAPRRAAARPRRRGRAAAADAARRLPAPP